MAYGEAKVYFDGSHYIAIPYVPNPHRKKAKVKEKETASPSVENEEDKEEYQENFLEEEITGSNENEPKNEEKLGYITDNTVILDKKEIFEGLYKESFGLKRHKQKKYILERISDLFDSVEEAEFFVDLQLNRKYRNAICRRTRLMRKVNLQEFNYFCTFTYDSKKHTEESFKKGLKTCFRNFCYRQNWKYV